LNKNIKIALSALFVLSILAVSPRAVFDVLADNRSDPHEPPSEVIADFNGNSLTNNLGGESGTWESDPGDTTQFAVASFDDKVKHGAAGSSLKLEYSVKSVNDAANGFWTQLHDLNASLYDHFEFWVKGDEDKGYTTLFKIEFKKTVKDPDGRAETIKASYVVKGVTGRWQKVSIPLNVMNGILDWSALEELVISFEKRRVDNPRGTIYFDDFAFVKTWQPGPRITDIVPHNKKKTDKDNKGEEFARLLIARLHGFPDKVFVKKEFPRDDHKFLLAIARDTWRYFDNIVDKERGLPIDNIQFGEKVTISGDTLIGDYTSVTNVGLYLMCVVSAYDLGFISRKDAVKRLQAAIDSVEKLEKHNGFPYNYYDVTIFQRTSNFISFVDSG